MRIVFMGTPDFAVQTLEELIAAGHEIVGVVSQPDKPQGRKKQLLPTPVKACALSHGLTVYQPERIKNPEFFEVLKELDPEVIVVVAYGQIIPQRILDLPRYGCLNVHASLLPAYRGAAPIQWAVINGEELSGVTIMQMDAGLDTGDMLAQVDTRLRPEETSGSLFDRLAMLGGKLLVKVLPLLGSPELEPEAQPVESTTPYARMITKQDGLMDWTRSAKELECQVRGMDPWPAAYTTLKGKTLKVWKAKAMNFFGGELFEGITGKDPKESAGKVFLTDENGIHVKTGEGILIISELQLEGKKRMSAADFLRGCSLENGTVLGE